MISAALYHRVSTTDQNPTLAHDELTAAAPARDMTVVLNVAETGSGVRNDRPGLARVLDAARRGQVKAVLVWKLDRFGRSALDLLANVRALEDAGCRFIAVTQGIDIRPGSDPMFRLFLTVLATVAELQREWLSERTRLGLDKARRTGKRLGRPLAANAPAGPDVRYLRAQGRSWGQIAHRLGCTPSAARRAFVRFVENGEVD